MKVLALFAVIGIAAVNSASVKTPSVTVDLYYEALCPGCHQFITLDLEPTMQKLGKYIDVGIYPFGNARFTERPDGGFDFECQHGEKECVGNIQQNCLLDGVQDKLQVVQILTCIENSDDVVASFEDCLVEGNVEATKVAEIVECSKSLKGEQLTHDTAVIHQSHQPDITYVPYVDINKSVWDGMGSLMDTLCEDALKDVPECQSTSVEATSVTIDLYYEAMCGGCHDFIIEDLEPTMEKLGKYIEIGIYPFGNAEFTERPDGGFDFECQHGEKECVGNIQQNCLVDGVQDKLQMVQILTCIEKSNDVVENFESCMVEGNVDADKVAEIVECSKGLKGEQLTHDTAVIHQSHKPQINYVPYIDINKALWNGMFSLTETLCDGLLSDVPECQS